MAYINHSEVTSKKNENIIYILSALAFSLLLFTFYIIYQITKSKVLFLLIAIASLGTLFISLLIFHKTYDFLIKKFGPYKTLIFVYLIIVLNAYFATKFYSIELAFLGFIIAGIIVYDSKIDLRFFFVSALLLFGYIPILLIGKENNISSTIAIYVYYFLVIGIIIMLMENIKKYKLSLDLSKLLESLYKKIENITIVLGFVTFEAVIVNNFINITRLKWLIVYMFIISLVIYIITKTIKKVE